MWALSTFKKLRGHKGTFMPCYRYINTDDTFPKTFYGAVSNYIGGVVDVKGWRFFIKGVHEGDVQVPIIPATMKTEVAKELVEKHPRVVVAIAGAQVVVGVATVAVVTVVSRRIRAAYPDPILVQIFDSLMGIRHNTTNLAVSLEQLQKALALKKMAEESEILQQQAAAAAKAAEILHMREEEAKASDHARSEESKASEHERLEASLESEHKRMLESSHKYVGVEQGPVEGATAAPIAEKVALEAMLLLGKIVNTSAPFLTTEALDTLMHQQLSKEQLVVLQREVSAKRVAELRVREEIKLHGYSGYLN